MKTAHLLLLILLFCISASAKTVNLADYATPNDGEDDSAGFQRAVDDLKASGGGILIVGEGEWDLNSGINFVTYQNYISFLIQGDKAAVIKLSQGPAGTAFYTGNTNQFEMRDLVFIGDPDADYDVGYIYFATYTMKTRVVGCQFYGISAKNSLFYLGNTDAVFINDQFEGNAAGVAHIQGVNYGGVTVQSSQFVDYGNFKSTFYSKTPDNSGPWIRVEATSVPPANAMSQRVVRIEDTRFDEGAPAAIMLKNTDFLSVSGITVNVSGTSNGTGIHLDNVKYADIRQSRFGYTNNSRPAVYAINGTTFSVSGITVSGGVYAVRKDSASVLDAPTPYACKACKVVTAEGEPSDDVPVVVDSKPKTASKPQSTLKITSSRKVTGR